MAEERAARIAGQNDAFRRTGQGGRILITAGVAALGAAAVEQALAAVRAFDAFTPENDPYGEHDFGSFALKVHKLYWKIDYYDREERYGSPDPADPAQTSRVLTILLVEEY